jgi:hypothetical protein
MENAVIDLNNMMINNKKNDVDCAEWCKCVNCRGLDFDAFEQVKKDIAELEAYLDQATQKIDSMKLLHAHAKDVWEDLQDKYAGENMEDRERFVMGVRADSASDSGSDKKDKTD